LNSGKAAPVVAPKAEPKAETKPVEPQQTTRITSENAEMLANAQKLRKSAASLLEQAQTDLSRDRQTNTARRARIAAGATDDALNREAFAKTMNNLADAMERGEVRYLKGVKSRPDLMLFKNELTLALGRHARKNDKAYDWYKKEPVTDAAIRDGAEFNRPHPYGDWFDHAARELEAIQGMKPAAAYIEKLGRGNRSRNVSLSDEAIGKILDIKKTIAKKGIKTPYQFARILETVEDYQKLKAAGIKSDSDLADALIEYRNLEAGKKQESPLVKAERELIGKKFEGFDFFPTPPALAERMAQELDIKPGMKVLEPSAGKGDLADAVKAAQPEADVKVIEPLSDLREILTMKNHEVIDTNFENFETDQKFDRVIMNPPFSKNRDIRHVRKAYELLAPGGKMIAIMGNHFTFANDKESVEFRDWLDAVGGTSESLGQVFAGKDAFRQTGANSQLVTIEKPAETSAKAEPAKTEDISIPRVLYHGTDSDFSTFDTAKSPHGFWFSEDASDASDYGNNVLRASLDIKNPAYFQRTNGDKGVNEAIAKAKADGHDGIVVTSPRDGDESGMFWPTNYVAFYPEQIKPIPERAPGAIGKLSERINQFIEELKGRNLTPEQQGIYNVFTRKEKVYKIKDLKDVGEYVAVEGGRRKFGAQHVLIKHYGTNIGPVTAEEILQIGEIIRDGKVEFDGDTRIYTRPAEDGALLKVVVGKNRKDGSDTLITFHSKNRKAPTRATREPSALQGAFQKAETSATSNISAGPNEVKGPESDLIKPEEKDFGSATDYLKALTAWREKTGNITAAEAKRRDRALRFADRAAKTGQKASGLFRQADKISERFYMGQPILVGHHSERGARAAQNRMHNKMDAALKEEKKAEYYSQRAESAEKNKSISSADEDAIVKLKAKLESLSKVQERMKQANKVVKASKLSDAEKITKLQEQGFSEAKAKNLLEKDFAGRVGFPAYALQNNNAEMSRLKKRIEELSVKQSQQTQKIEFDGGEIVDNVAENRLQIFFDSKPDEATREKLKSNGFRWAPSAGAWQMHRSVWANRKAESITGAKIPAPQPAKAASTEDQYYNDLAEKPEQVETKNAPPEAVLNNEDLLPGDIIRYTAPGGRDSGDVLVVDVSVNGDPDIIRVKWPKSGFEANIHPSRSKIYSVSRGSMKSARPLYSAEYLVARYAKRGLNKAGQVVKRGLDLIRQAGVTFARWARQMINDFGKAIRKHLRTLWTDLDNFNKRLGRTGAISGRSTGLKNGEVGQSSPPPGKTAQEILTDKWAKKGLEKAYRFGDKLYQAGKTTFADWQKYMRQRFKDIDASELTGLWNDIKNPELTLTTPLRDNSVRASAKAFKLLGVEPGPLYADYSGLWGKQKQDYFKSPEAVKAAVEYVLENPDFSTTEADGNAGLVREGDANEVKPFVKDGYVFEHPKVKIRLEKKQGAYHIRSVHLLNDQQFERDKNRRDSAPLDAGVTSDKLTERFTPDTSGSHQSQVDAQASSTKNDTPSGQKVKSDKSPTELKQMVTSRGLVWKRVDKDTYELELTDPNTGKTSVVETIRRPKGTDNIWNVDNWTTFDNKGTGSGSFTSLKVAKAAIKAHARDAFNQRIYRENGVVKDRQRDEALKKKRERGLEQDKERDAREAARHEKRKEKAEEFIAKGKKKKAPEPEKPKTWRDQARRFIEKAEEVLFDAWAPVRRLQETIKKAAGVSELPESLDLYQKLEVVAGKVEAGTRIFKDKYFKQIKDYLVENNINYNEANRFLAIMHAEERNDAIAERNPAFALTGAPGSGIETETARKEIAEHKKNGTYEKLLKFAEMTYRLNNALLDEQVRYGLLSQKQRDAYRRYKHYTPMKSPPDQGFVLDRTAFGRRSEATDQLAYIEKAIDVVYKRGERKQVINTALNLFSKYSNPKLYREYEPDQVQYYDKRTGKVRLRADTSKLYNNPAVIWSRDVNSGELKAFEIKDAGLQNALNRQYSDTGVEQKAFRYFARVNRWLAGVSTAYNPEFIFTNLLRDVQQGAASVGVSLPEGSVKKFVENLGRAKKAISDARAGKVTADTRLLEEFQLAGGKTGYSELSRLEDTARNLEREISEAQTGGRWYDTKQSLIKVKDWIADWNDAIETRTRFAGYLTAKEAGFSTQKSAAFAKGMTINFNKKGTWAPVFNSLYLFSSASLGGSFVTANIIGKAAKTPKGRAMIAGAIGLGFVMELLNRAVAGDDDDEGVNYYDKVPDYIKDSNYVFMLPGTKGKYFAIPMPYGLNVLPSIGRNMAASMFGTQSFKSGAANVVGAVLNSFNPIGGDNRGFGYQLVPTAARPFIDIATNSSWTGRKIRPDRPAFGAKVARSELYFDQESKVLVKATKLLNELTGGDRYTGGFVSLSPADVGHLLESFTGGVGRTLSRGADTVTRVVTGEAPELDNVPVVRRFGGEATDYNTWQTFKENSEIVEDFERARRERNIEYLRANRQLLPAVALYKNIGKRITMIRKKPSLSEPEKQKLILSMQKLFNKKFKEMNEKALSKN
jgi:predicted RNA methylase